MKAIVNVNKKSAYAHLNGLTFEVSQVLTKIVALNIDGTITDFGHKEVIIVDLNKEVQKEYDSYNWGSANCYQALMSYVINNGIQYRKPEYNCPA